MNQEVFEQYKNLMTQAKTENKMSRPLKKCPVCESTKWDYDVVTMDCVSFCGDCYNTVKRIGNEYDLTIWDGISRVFPNAENFRKALKQARENIAKY